MSAVAPASLDPAERLKITETFYSLQGEADASGWPSFFIRLTGCPLRCTYCDTEYAFHGGVWRGIDSLVDEARASGARHVCVTGGEPLSQKNCLKLLERLCDASLDVARNRYDNLGLLGPRDQVKFVICDRQDYEWAREQLLSRDLAARCQVLFSPAAGQLPPGELADWILADRLQVRFQLQLHKLLWGEVPGR
jgi:7-carboxy-7-deazaguanine synthase